MIIMKKYYSTKEKSNHIIFKILKKTIFFFLFLFLIYLYNKKNVLYRKNNMKHAILLLSSYGVEYLNNFLGQFNNDKRYDIYIHLDGKTKRDIDKNKTIIKSNIKFCQYIYHAKRFSIQMADVMYELLSIAYKSDNYNYYHFFSESNYLVKSLDKFYNFFIEHNLNSYVNCSKTKNILYKNQSNLFYQGSQWMSLHKNIVKKIISNKDLYNKYKDEIKNHTIIIKKGAIDEFIIQNLIILDICNETPDKCNVINFNLCFIRWRGCKHVHCPNYLNIDNLSEDEINKIKEKYLIIRKINFKDTKSIELVNKLKNLSLKI